MRVLDDAARIATVHERGPDETYASFLMVGIIGLNAVSTGIFGVGVVLVQARDQGILRRLKVTPQSAWTFVSGQLLASGLIVLFSTLLLLAVGIIAFHVPLPHRLLEWCVVFGVGTLAFLTIGYALAASISDVRTAQIVGNAVFMFFMLLGGVWFPLAVLPPHFQWAGHFLPLSHFLQTLRAVGYQGQPLGHHLSSLVVLGVWSLIAVGAAGVQFRRSDTL